MKTKNFKKWTFIYFLNSFFIILILGLVQISCEKKEQKLKIGVIAPLTGDGATYGAAMQKGIDLAIEEINKVKISNKLLAIYQDDKLLAKEAISGFNKLVQVDKVPVILGSAASRVTLSIAPLAESNKVVLLSSISTADELKFAGDYFFRDVPPNEFQGKSAAEFIINALKKTKVAVYYKNDDYGKNLAEAFKKFFKNLSGEILMEDNYNPSQDDFRNSLTRIKQKTPEVIYFPGNYEESAIILRQAKEAGIASTFVGGDGSYSPQLIKIAGEAAEGSYYTVMALPLTTADKEIKEKIENFNKNFKVKYGEEPDVYAAYAYDALYLVSKAIDMGGYTSDGIKNALYTLTYKGVTGINKFDEFGEVDKPYQIYVVKNGKFEIYGE